MYDSVCHISVIDIDPAHSESEKQYGEDIAAFSVLLTQREREAQRSLLLFLFAQADLFAVLLCFWFSVLWEQAQIFFVFSF